jgi:hypothetical protein
VTISENFWVTTAVNQKLFSDNELNRSRSCNAFTSNANSYNSVWADENPSADEDFANYV